MRVEVPAAKLAEAKFMAEKCGDDMFKKYKMKEGVKCMGEDDIVNMYLNNVW